MAESGQRFSLTARLAVRDYRHEWIMSGCSILALAGVLVPLLVLFGLKYGIISSLLDPLIENPRYREVTPMASGSYRADWFETMRAREDVQFVVPRTRAIAATMRLRNPAAQVGRIISVELVPSAAGDPVLPAGVSAPQGLTEVLASWSAADRLAIDAGDSVEGILVRTRGGSQETVRLPLLVTDVVPVGAFARDGLFVSTQLIAAVEDFLDGRAVPELGWEGTPARTGTRTYAGFRLYAGSIDQVASVRDELLSQNIQVRTSIADISLVQALDRNLSVAYWIIALITISGFCLSFGTSVWANIDRKQREFSVLRLVGFRTGHIICFPILQAALTAAFAWLLACIMFLGIQALLNTLFAASIGAGQPVSRLQAWHLLVAFALTLVAAVSAAAIAGRRVAQLEPSIGLRDR